jgi:hypothetical protein
LTYRRGGLLVRDVDENAAIVLHITLELFAFLHASSVETEQGPLALEPGTTVTAEIKTG